MRVDMHQCSMFEAHIRTNSMDIHLIPPHNHQVNAAEHVIATFKEHFISALITVDKDYPLQLWDDFLLQVELTLNLIQFTRRDPIKNEGNKCCRPVQRPKRHDIVCLFCGIRASKSKFVLGIMFHPNLVISLRGVP